MTKMHDNLPIILFCPENFLILLKNQEYDYAAYFLPWTLLIISLSSAFNLVRIQRIQLLEISYYYLIGYYMILKNANLPHGLTETLSPNTIYLTMFDSKLLIQAICTIRTLIMILRSHTNQEISLNRCSSNPLEHLFGNLRIRSHFVHNIYRCIKKIALNQLIENMNLTKEWKEIRRVRSFGVTVPEENLLDDNINIPLFEYDSKEMAFGLLETFGLNISDTISQEVVCKKDFVVCLIDMLNDLLEENNHKKKGKTLTMNDVTLGVTTNLKARNLFQAKNMVYSSISDDKNNKYGIENEKLSTIKRLIGTKMLITDLKSVVAETSSTFQIVIEEPIRSKKSCIQWIANHWNYALEIMTRYSIQLAK